MGITLSKWRKQYGRILETRELKPCTVQEKRRYAKLLCRAIGPNKKLKKIRPLHIARAIRAVFAGGEEAKARRMLSTARDMFGEAAANGYLDRNPASNVKPHSCRVRRSRLSLDQWQATQKALAQGRVPWRRLFALLALVTGQRRSDLIKMRFADVWDRHLHIIQIKTGERIALPLSLKLKAVEGGSLDNVIRACRGYAPVGETLLRKSTGEPLSGASLTKAWAGIFKATASWARTDRTAPSLAEIRSLSERLYSAQGVDTQTLLGHRKASTTAIYHDDRGLSAETGAWRVLTL
jgi:integrase